MISSKSILIDKNTYEETLSILQNYNAERKFWLVVET